MLKKIDSQSLDLSKSLNKSRILGEYSDKTIESVPQKQAQITTNLSTNPKLYKCHESSRHIFFRAVFSTKAMIILGGIFFVLAAYFCIKYSIENNLLTPQVHIAGAMVFGLLLFGLGFAFDGARKSSAFSGDFHYKCRFYAHAWKIGICVFFNVLCGVFHAYNVICARFLA